MPVEHESTADSTQDEGQFDNQKEATIGEAAGVNKKNCPISGP